ncbi:YeeE/YedE family protein [Thalassomonas haliotis]|uniref:YeeE/YedE family protein n=1 Tax=Thalassomonas haliotis TaxID=485448 RepID=A0ABY7VFU4_9GAMM|nr:YeeE/YedE family protein [Thalassomonas haliotis]WDE12039.1 YeeE/YedE family protein [Thalassomonas haliotis]
MTEFTPYSAILGGAFLGLAALLLLVLNGRVAGISGIIRGIFTAGDGAGSWRWFFLLGLVLAPLLAPSPVELPENIRVSWWLILPAGFLVGLGSALGAGCTSGHGICGIGRLSGRSLTATLTFMATAMLVVYLIRLLMA